MGNTICCAGRGVTPLVAGTRTIGPRDFGADEPLEPTRHHVNGLRARSPGLSANGKDSIVVMHWNVLADGVLVQANASARARWPFYAEV